MPSLKPIKAIPKGESTEIFFSLKSASKGKVNLKFSDFLVPSSIASK